MTLSTPELEADRQALIALIEALGGDVPAALRTFGQAMQTEMQRALTGQITSQQMMGELDKLFTP